MQGALSETKHKLKTFSSSIYIGESQTRPRALKALCKIFKNTEIYLMCIFLHRLDTLNFRNLNSTIACTYF